MRSWFVQELFLSIAETKKAKKVRAAFANAVNYLIYFLPAGARITAKPRDSLPEYERWLKELDRLTATAEAAAMKFCEKHRYIADGGDSGAEEEDEEGGIDGGSASSSDVVGIKRRKRGITTAFYGMHRRLSAIYTHNPRLFKQAANVVVEVGQLPMQEET